MGRELKGVAAAPGIAVATIVHFHTDFDFVPERAIQAAAVKDEVARLDEAIQAASKSILFLRHELSAALSDHDAKIYDAQLALLHDATLRKDLVTYIEGQLVNAETALQKVVARYEKVFSSMEDAAMRERAADLRDIGRQVLSALLARERKVFTAEGQDFFFVADEFLPSDAGVVDRDHLRGIITARGGKCSHGAILARSLGIPAVLAVEEVMVRAKSGDAAVLDGDAGVVLLRPNEEEQHRYRLIMDEREAAERRVFEVRFAPAVTLDGHSVSLLANVESVRDLDQLELDVVNGIGLFRTEFAFMERLQFPAEEEQWRMYRTAIEAVGKDRVVTFRTLDVGGDKPLNYFRTPEERNPVLGWRGLRICLDWPDIFYTQLRAILRAGEGRPRILLPMVSAVEEVQRAVDIVDRIRSDLAQAGEPSADKVEIGVMVEVPAIAEVLDAVLPLVDFVSVGTNDLAQYLLAVDRDNPRVASLYDPYHPALIRVLHRIAGACRAAGKPVSVCGEVAGDHYFTPLLLGMGFTELSMAPVFLPRVKLMVRSFTMPECVELVDTALAMGAAGDIRKLVRGRCRERWALFLEQPD